MNKIICKDHTVTGKEFELRYDKELELYYTFPQPSQDDLTSYYKSDAYISHTDATKSILDKIYQKVKNYTIRKKIKLIDSFVTNEKHLLDIGCGTGDFLNVAKNNNWYISGVEPNEKAKKIAIKKTDEKENIFTRLEDLSAHYNEVFDVITLWHVLEHIPDYDTYIKKIKSLLKKNGYLIVAVPNYNSFDAKYYNSFWAAYDVPRHLWHFSKNAIQKIFSKNEMKVVEILPMRFDAYYVSLLSEKYKTGNSNFLKAMWSGFQSNWKANKTKEYSSLIYIIRNN